MSDLHTCPNPDCKANLIASEIPEDKRCNDDCPDGFCPTHPYGKGTRYFLRSVGFYAFDRTLFYFCPDCDAAWHRFPPGGTNSLRRTAELHMKREARTRYETAIDNPTTERTHA